MASIGELVVNLRTNSAQFNSGISDAREALRKTGAQANATREQLSKLATKGFGEIVPLSFRAENALERFFARASEGSGIMATAAKASIALGAGLLAFKAGERISEWLALGTSVENYKKQIEEARKEQDALIATMNKQRGASQGLDKELANVTGDFRKVIELDRANRDANILANFTASDPRRAGLLMKSEAIATEQLRIELEKRRADSEKWANDQLALLQKEREAQFKTWQDETTTFVAQLQNRAQARAQFEAQFGQGRFAQGSVTEGLRASLDLRKDIEDQVRQLAFAKREGRISESDVFEGLNQLRERAAAAGQDIKDKFGGAFPAVNSSVEQALTSVNNLGAEFEKARAFIDATVPTLGSLTSGLEQFRGMLAAMPDATQAAQGAIATLSQQYRDLAVSIANAQAQAVAFAQTMG